MQSLSFSFSFFFSKNNSFNNNKSVSLRFMIYLLKTNCQYNQLISNDPLYKRVTTQNKENLPANITGKANQTTTMIAAFHNRRAIFAGDDRRRQTVALRSVIAQVAYDFWHVIKTEGNTRSYKLIQASLSQSADSELETPTLPTPSQQWSNDN